MSNLADVPMSPLHGLGAAGSVRSRALAGSGAPAGGPPAAGVGVGGVRLRSVARARLVGPVLAVAMLATVALASPALGSTVVARTIGKSILNNFQPVLYGSVFRAPAGVAVNQEGAGGVPAGTFYVVDSGASRIQEFNPAGAFVSAWDKNVGGRGQYEICTVEASCIGGEYGHEAGALGEPKGIAVDQATGNVYVADQGNGRIDVYSATGTFEGAFGWSTREAGGKEELQLCTVATGCQRGSSGVEGGQFGGEIGGIAVAPAGSPNAGDVYVADKSSKRIDEFKPTLEGGIVMGVSFVRAFGFNVNSGGSDVFEECEVAANCVEGGSGTGEGQFGSRGPSDVAVDSEGDVFAVDTSNKRVEEFSSAPAPITKEFGKATLTATCGTGELLNVAVDPSLASSEHVLVSCKRSSSSDIVVQELEHSGAAGQVEGSEMTSTASSGIAVTGASLGGNVYVTSASENVLEGVYVLNGSLPSVSAPTSITAHTAIFHGSVVSENVEVGYHFEYSTDGVTWVSVPASDLIVAPKAGSEAVEQAVSGLVGSQTYFVRLASTRPPGGMTLPGASTTFTTSASEPVISAAEARSVGSGTVTLAAHVNPENQPTSWYFEYISQGDWAANGNSFTGPHLATSAPASSASAGDGGFAELVSEGVSSLAPDTSYRFRLVAANATGRAVGAEALFATYAASEVLTGCPNEAFRVFAGAALPDCRAYEQASPVEKLGARVGWGSPVHGTEAAADGSRVSFGASAGFPVSTGTAGYNGLYIASRADGAWSSDGLITVAKPEVDTSGEPLGWNEDLSVSASNLSGEGEIQGIYLRDTATGQQQLALPGEIYNLRPAGFAGTSASLLFGSTSALAPGESVNGRSNAYLLAEGAVDAVGLVPTSGIECAGATCAKTAEGSIPGPYQWFTESPSLTAYWSASEAPYRESAISTDGSRVFFTKAGTSGGGLFMREGGTRTVQVSAANSGVTDPNGEKAAAFLQATPSGSKALFLSCQKLTSNSTAVSTSTRTCSATSSQGQDLYLWEAEAPAGARLTDLSVDPTVGDAHGAQVVGFVGASSHGTDAYFVANGVLASGATPGNCTIGVNATGECSLYLAHVTAGAPSTVTVTFVARLQAQATVPAESDRHDWQPAALSESFKSSRVSASGSVLFSSTSKLASYNNHGVAELYRYAPGESAPTCVSCNPTGVAPTGRASLQPSEEGGFIRHRTEMAFLTRNISADGDRVFFDTPDKLVAADVNGDDGCPNINIGGETSSVPPVDSHPLPSCTDVYEWEASGEGTCTEVSPSYSSQDEGCIYLISSGDSSGPSVFADADASGDNVFFFTESPLVPQDGDQLGDLYDARVDGGLASQQGSPSVPVCTAEGCRGASSVPASGQSPGSATFSGSGNLLVTAPAPAVKAKAKPLSRAQKLARALRVCGKRPKHKRAACRRRARKRYGVAAKAKRSARNVNRRAQ